MRVVFVSPAWGRFAVTRLALAQRAVLCGQLAERGHEATAVIVADDDNLDIARQFGFETVAQNNEFLGRKFNDGFCRARDLGAELIVVLGSDDWMHVSLFDRLPDPSPPMPEPTDDNPVVSWSPGVPEAITGREIALVDLVGGTGNRWHTSGRSGVIPWIFPAAAFERSGFRPVMERQQRGTDFSLVAGLGQRPEWVWVDPHPYARVDFKSDVNLNPFWSDSRAGHGEVDADPWGSLAQWYGDDLAGLARETHEVLATKVAA